MTIVTVVLIISKGPKIVMVRQLFGAIFAQLQIHTFELNCLDHCFDAIQLARILEV